MIGLLMSLAILTFLFWIGYKITGVLLRALIWLLIELPIALIMWCFALICCCTVILIPVGIKIFSVGFRVLIPI